MQHLVGLTINFLINWLSFPLLQRLSYQMCFFSSRQLCISGQEQAVRGISASPVEPCSALCGVPSPDPPFFSSWHHSLTPFLSTGMGMFSEGFIKLAQQQSHSAPISRARMWWCWEALPHTLEVCLVAQPRQWVHTHPRCFRQLTPRSGQH